MSASTVAVVGGGPAGLAAAIAIQRQGLECVVLDARLPPIDKACGEGLMPGAVAALTALGVDLQGAGRPFVGIGYRDGSSAVDGHFPKGSIGLGVRRVELHRRLVQRAEQVGCTLRWRERVTAVQAQSDGWQLETRVGATLRCQWLVGADGLHSRVRRWVGLEAVPQKAPHRYGVRRHLRTAPWSNLVEVFWGEGAEAYVTPIAPDAVGVAILWTAQDRRAGTQENHRFDSLLERFPTLLERLAGSPALSKDRGAGDFATRLRAGARERVALVGDASGYVDPITGEGLEIAFRQAELLARAIQNGDLADYQGRQRATRRRPERITQLALVMARHPELRRRVLRGFASRPQLFEELLAVHVGARSWPRMATALRVLANAIGG